MEKELYEAVKFIRERTKFIPKVGIVLGSGLGKFAEKVEIEAEFKFAEIPNFPKITVDGHAGNLILGKLQGIDVAVLQGRPHYYQGYTMAQVVFYVYVLKQLGINKLILTNAVGSCDKSIVPNSFVAIKDHINLTGNNPLIGDHYNFMGTTFIPTNHLYSKRIREIAKTVGDELNLPIKEGIFAQFSGPSFETPAEIKMAQLLNCKIVGMSTAIEAIAGKHAGLEVGAISLVTNYAAGLSKQAPSHIEVQENGKISAENFEKLILGILAKL